MVHRGGSRLGGTAAVRSVGNLTATGWHLVQEFLGYRWPSTLEAIVGFTLSKSTSASVPARAAYGRPHGRQHNAGQDDEDGLLEGWRAYVAMFCIQCNRYRRVGGRDRQIVYVDRLQRYVEAAPDGIVLASQPGSNCKDLPSRPKPRGIVSANLQPHTVEVE